MESLRDIEACYSFSLPGEFHALHAQVAGVFASSSQSYMEFLQPHQMVEAKRGVLDPDLLPTFKTDFGDSICFRVPDQVASREPGFVLYCHEDGGLVSLGRSLLAVLGFVACFLEAAGLYHAKHGDESDCARQWLAGHGLRPYPPVDGTSLRQLGRRILTSFPVLDQEDLETAVADGSLSRPYFGYNPGLSNHVLGQLVPVARCWRAEHYWGRGKPDVAKEDWEAALAEDPQCGAAHWGLGVLYSCLGDIDRACSHYAAVVEGNWCSLYPDIPTEYHDRQEWRSWHGIPAVAASYLREHASRYERVTQHPHIFSIVTQGSFHDSTAWSRALDSCTHQRRYREAKTIALSGLSAKPWHGGEASEACIAALRTCAKAEGPRVDYH